MSLDAVISLFFQVALLYCHSDIVVAEMPPVVWKLGVQGLICPLASALGYKPFYDEYHTA